MGTCTSTARHQQKQHKRAVSKNSIVLALKPPPPLPPLPSTSFSNRQYRYRRYLSTDFDIFSSSSTKPSFHETDTNSLIQLYSTNIHTNKNINNNNSNNYYNNTWMSSSSSSVVQIPSRNPVPKTRVAVYHQLQPQRATVTIRSKNASSIVISNNQIGSMKPMSITNHPPPPMAMQTRFGFIPRPTAPGLQQIRGSTYASRSRSISPTSNGSLNSSSSSVSSQRLATAQTTSKPTSATSRSIPSNSTNNHTSKPSTTVVSPRQRDASATRTNTKTTFRTTTTASRMRSRTPSRNSIGSSSSSVASPPPPPPSASITSIPITLPSSSSLIPSPSSHTTTTTKADVTTIRDRYKTQKRMNFFTRRTPIPTANGSPVASSIKQPESLIITTEKQPLSSRILPKNSQNNDLKGVIPSEISSTNGDSAHANIKLPSNPPPSAHLSQGNRHRQRAISMLSSASAISDVLNQDALLADDNCSLKSDDLMCDYEDTLTMDSTSKNENTDSQSLVSLTTDTNKISTTNIPVTPTRPNASIYQHTSMTQSSTATTTTTTVATNDKSNGSLRESLNELNRLSNRVEQTIDNEQNRRLMSRSVSLKPPSTYLPPLEDSEQITMDIESYRQVMKDVTVVKTILHQLDRLLKNSDGANMTDSMIGSFHECHDPLVNIRRFSSSFMDTNPRNAIDENASHEDLLKEIATLRKEREQDKQTIKLLQEQMYKYSSQANGS